MAEPVFEADEGTVVLSYFLTHAPSVTQQWIPATIPVPASLTVRLLLESRGEVMCWAVVMVTVTGRSQDNGFDIDLSWTRPLEATRRDAMRPPQWIRDFVQSREDDLNLLVHGKDRP